jgi:hypothetical protein
MSKPLTRASLAAKLREADQLHPETLKTLRQLVKLHGRARLIRALHQIEAK